MDANRTTIRRDESHTRRQQKRPAWRQHLVQTERGVVRGVRGGSAFFVHFFGCSLVLAIGFVLGLSPFEWAAVALCATVVLAAEMFNQAIKALVAIDAENREKTKALVISTAAVMVAVVGSLLTVTLIFAAKLKDVWAD